MMARRGAKSKPREKADEKIVSTDRKDALDGDSKTVAGIKSMLQDAAFMQFISQPPRTWSEDDESDVAAAHKLLDVSDHLNYVVKDLRRSREDLREFSPEQVVEMAEDVREAVEESVAGIDAVLSHITALAETFRTRAAAVLDASQDDWRWRRLADAAASDADADDDGIDDDIEHEARGGRGSSSPLTQVPAAEVDGEVEVQTEVAEDVLERVKAELDARLRSAARSMGSSKAATSLDVQALLHRVVESLDVDQIQAVAHRVQSEVAAEGHGAHTGSTDDVKATTGNESEEDTTEGGAEHGMASVDMAALARTASGIGEVLTRCNSPLQ